MYPRTGTCNRIEGTRVEYPSLYPKGGYRHPVSLPIGNALECGGGNHWHPPEGKCPPQRLSTWSTHRERNRNGYIGAEACAESSQRVSGPHVPSLLRPAKFLQHHKLWMPTDDSGGIRCRTPHVKATGSYLGPSRGRNRPKQVPQPALQINQGGLLRTD